MECIQDKNSENCNCSYEPCSRKGRCCLCLKYHVRMRELPACVFPNDIERTFNRSFEKFAELVKQGKI